MKRNRLEYPAWLDDPELNERCRWLLDNLPRIVEEIDTARGSVERDATVNPVEREAEDKDEARVFNPSDPDALLSAIIDLKSRIEKLESQSREDGSEYTLL